MIDPGKLIFSSDTPGAELSHLGMFETVPIVQPNFQDRDAAIVSLTHGELVANAKLLHMQTHNKHCHFTLFSIHDLLSLTL